jgi:predicted amidohydrolase
VRDLARELKIYLAIGFPELRGSQVYNSVVIFGPDGAVVSRYSKTHCGGEPHNTEGTEFPVVTTPLGRWGTLICLDRQLPETSRILAIKGAQMILVPSYGMYGEINDVMMRTRAFENGVYVVFVHPKRALIIDPKGKVIASDNGEGDQIVMGRITLDERVGTGPIRSRRPGIYGELVKTK